MQNYATLGKLCATFQESPNRIAKALEAASIKPTLSLNEMSYYDFDQATEAITRCKARHAERRAKRRTVGA